MGLKTQGNKYSAHKNRYSKNITVKKKFSYLKRRISHPQPGHEHDFAYRIKTVRY